MKVSGLSDMLTWKVSQAVQLFQGSPQRGPKESQRRSLQISSKLELQRFIAPDIWAKQPESWVASTRFSVFFSAAQSFQELGRRPAKYFLPSGSDYPTFIFTGITFRILSQQFRIDRFEVDLPKILSRAKLVSTYSRFSRVIMDDGVNFRAGAFVSPVAAAVSELACVRISHHAAGTHWAEIIFG